MIFPAGFDLLQGNPARGHAHQWIQSTEYLDQYLNCFFLVGAEMEISAGGISGLFHNFNVSYLYYYYLNLLIISSILRYTSLNCARD